MKVELWTRESPPCAYCEVSKKLLESKGISYINKVIGRDIDRDFAVNSTGQKTVPMVFVDDQMIGGFEQLRSYLLSKDLSQEEVMEECAYCGCQFSVKFEDDDDDVYFCPSCGQEFDEDDDYEEDEFDEYE